MMSANKSTTKISMILVVTMMLVAFIAFAINGPGPFITLFNGVHWALDIAYTQMATDAGGVWHGTTETIASLWSSFNPDDYYLSWVITPPLATVFTVATIFMAIWIAGAEIFLVVSMVSPIVLAIWIIRWLANKVSQRVPEPKTKGLAFWAMAWINSWILLLAIHYPPAGVPCFIVVFIYQTFEWEYVKSILFS